MEWNHEGVFCFGPERLAFLARSTRGSRRGLHSFAASWLAGGSPRGTGMSHLYAWGAILVIVVASVVGDVLLARAMKQVGDVGTQRRRCGLMTVVGRVLSNRNFVLGVAFMAIAFFSLLFALSWGDVSLVAPAAASLTFIGNAFAARIFLHERVDRRRWIAAMLVAAGVTLLAG
jgi:drug/metabolite transporter (DMT)-like permease